MKNRKAFLSSVASGAALLLAAPAPAQSASPAKAPSAAALAIATAMRRFDPKLSDAQIQRIAKDIEANQKGAAELNPPKKRLQNWDEPVTTFRAQA